MNTHYTIRFCTLLFSTVLYADAGDFAVLLKSGMTLRVALVFNMLSSVLSFGGCVVGVLIGTSTKSANDWLYPIIAGIFLYIALVNMVRAPARTPATTKPCPIPLTPTPTVFDSVHIRVTAFVCFDFPRPLIRVRVVCTVRILLL